MEFAAFSIEILLVLFFVAVIAGVVDTLAGGGGLLVIPALILAGLPPLAALGTNKLQGSMGTATSTFMLFKHKRIRWHENKLFMLCAFIGSAIGTIVVQFIDAAVLSFMIPLVLVLIATYFLVSPTPKENPDKAKLSDTKYRTMVLPTIGFYDGMFGPGTGSFFALAGVVCKGHGLISSTAVAKSLNFSTNIASLIVFLMAGQIVWVAGAAMMLGQVVGAWLGSHFLFKINPSYLRVLIVVMCLGMLGKYLYATL